MNVLVHIVLNLTVKFFFQRSYCAFSKYSLGLTPCRVDFHCMSTTTFLNSQANSVPSFIPKIPEIIVFCNHGWQRCYSLFRIFCLHPLCMYCSIKQIFGGIVIKLHSSLFASISTQARSIHQISYLNLAEAFIFGNIRLAKLLFVYEVFDFQTCFTFHTGRLLAFTKLHTDPKTKQHQLLTFRLSLGPRFHPLWFRRFDSKLELELFQQHQIN